METELTKAIKTALWKYTNKMGTFGCEEVTIGWYGNERVDYMTYDTKETFKCYEIKISKSDFHSPNHNSFVGHLNYYVLTQELYSKVSDEIPNGVGVIVYNGVDLSFRKRPKRREPTVDVQKLKDYFIRSLHREADNYRKIVDGDALHRRDREISRLNKANRNLRQRNSDLYNELYYIKHPERKIEERDLEG